MIATVKSNASPTRYDRAGISPHAQFAEAVASLIPACRALLIGWKIYIELKSGRWGAYDTQAIRAIRETYLNDATKVPQTLKLRPNTLSEIKSEIRSRKAGVN